MHDYKAALQSHQRALAIRINLLGEEHESTADNYGDLVVIQHAMHDYKAPLQSHQCELAIRIKLFGEQHEGTADSYRDLGVTQRAMYDYKAALQSHQRALAIRLNCWEKNMKALLTATVNSVKHNAQCMTTKQLFSLTSVH